MSIVRFKCVLSSKIGPKIVAARPYGSWITAIAQPLAVILVLYDKTIHTSNTFIILHILVLLMSFKTNNQFQI